VAETWRLNCHSADSL